MHWVSRRNSHLTFPLRPLRRPLTRALRACRICSTGQHLNLWTRRCEIIPLVSQGILQIHVSNRFNTTRQPLLERLGHEESVRREPGSERRPDLASAWCR